MVTEKDALVALLEELVEFNEAPRKNRWPGEMPEEFRDKLMAAIVGFEIEITRLEGKFKLSQNRPDDAPEVIAALSASDDQTDREVAEMMQGLI